MTRRFQGSAEWLDWRRGGYGASDAPIITEGNEQAWNQLHLVKLDVLPDPDATEAMQWGHDLEDPIAKRYAAKTGHPVQRVDRPLQHPELPHIRASLDRRRRRGRVVVELKAWSFPGDDFGPDGSDLVPMRFLYQVQQQMFVSGYEQADIAVFFGAVKQLRVYPIGRDQGLIDDIVSLETAAWAYVARGEVPPWPGPTPERPQLKADEIEPDDEVLELVLAHEAAQVDFDQAETNLKAVKGRLRSRLLEVGGTRGQLPDGRRFSVSHRPNRDGTSVGWEHLYLAARKRLLELGVPEDQLDFAVTALTTTHPGARPLRVSIAKPKEERSAA